MAETITPDKLKQIRAAWDMTQAEFAEMLSVPKDTYRRWEGVGESAVLIPAAVAAHIRTIQNLKKLYADWDRLATPMAKMEEFDAAIDRHEKLWTKLFPLLRRE